MAKLMALIRSILGSSDAPERPQNGSHDWATEKLEEQQRRIRALDAQVDVSRNPAIVPKRRATDR